MNSEKKEYLERKQRVLNALNSGIDFMKSNKFESEADVLQTQYNNAENEEFVITIVGEFSSGKSYLLNALMGEKYLPSYSGEATAAINFLKHKDKSEKGEAGAVYYKDGTVKYFDKADEETIAKYACTRAGDGVSDIDHIDIFLESRFLEDNVTLVDTPGLNGVKAGLASLTMDQIMKSSASVFMFNAKRPGSETDFDALAMLRKNVDNIFLVLNAVDLIDEEKGETVEDVVKTLENKYSKDFPDDKALSKFHPVSAKMALVGRSGKPVEMFGRTDFTADEKEKLLKNSGIPEFEEYLFAYLTKGEKGRQILLGPVSQLVKQINNICEKFEEELKVLNSNESAEELEKQKKELEQAAEIISENIEKQKNSITRDVTDAEREFKEEIESEASRFVTKYSTKINNFVDIEEINPEKIYDSIENTMKLILKNAFSNYSSRIEGIVLDYNQQMDEALNKALNFDGFAVPDLSELNLTSFESGIEKYEEELQAMKLESERIRSELEQVEDATFEARKLEKKRKALESRISVYTEEMHAYKRDAMLNMPNIVKTTRSDTEHYNRDGKLGGIVDKVFGRKTRSVTVDVVDSSARDAYKKQMNENLGSLQSDINELQAQAEKYRGKDPELAERAETRLQEKYKEKRNAELKFQKEFAEKIKETCAKQLRAQKEEIRDYVDDVAAKIKDSANSYFRANRNYQTNIIANIVTASLSAGLKKKCDELDVLTRNAKLQENERESRINVIQEQQKILRKIGMEALDLKDELEAIDTFVIE